MEWQRVISTYSDWCKVASSYLAIGLLKRNSNSTANSIMGYPRISVQRDVNIIHYTVRNTLANLSESHFFLFWPQVGVGGIYWYFVEKTRQGKESSVKTRWISHSFAKYRIQLDILHRMSFSANIFIKTTHTLHEKTLMMKLLDTKTEYVGCCSVLHKAQQCKWWWHWISIDKKCFCWFSWLTSITKILCFTCVACTTVIL